jgi:hypothetical protein
MFFAEDIQKTLYTMFCHLDDSHYGFIKVSLRVFSVREMVQINQGDLFPVDNSLYDTQDRKHG